MRLNYAPISHVILHVIYCSGFLVCSLFGSLKETYMRIACQMGSTTGSFAIGWCPVENNVELAVLNPTLPFASAQYPFGGVACLKFEHAFSACRATILGANTVL